MHYYFQKIFKTYLKYFSHICCTFQDNFDTLCWPRCCCTGLSCSATLARTTQPNVTCIYHGNSAIFNWTSNLTRSTSSSSSSSSKAIGTQHTALSLSTCYYLTHLSFQSCPRGTGLRSFRKRHYY